MKPTEIRERTKDRIGVMGFPMHPNIPLRTECNPRTSIEVGTQLVIQYSLAGLSFGADPIELKNWLKSEGIWEKIEICDRALFERADFDGQIGNELSWKGESLFVLAWSCNIVHKISPPTKECSLNSVFPKIPPEKECGKFLEGIRVRPLEDIICELDVYYCIHAAMRHPEIWANPADIKKLNQGVVLERRHALEWLTGGKLSWFDVTLDT